MINLKSKLARIILEYFFMNPQESLYLNELVRQFGEDKRNLAKKLNELENEGLLVAARRGNLKLYSINERFPLYDEYRKILQKTSGLEFKLKQIVESDKKILEAYIYGSYADDNLKVHSDIDLLVVGNHDILNLQKKLGKVQKEIGREINVVNMGKDEFERRIKTKDAFIKNLMKRKIKIK